jgi:hypothetical protein
MTHVTHRWYSDRPAKDCPSILGDYAATARDIRLDHEFAPGEKFTEPEIRIFRFRTKRQAAETLGILIASGYRAILAGNETTVAYTDGCEIYNREVA